MPHDRRSRMKIGTKRRRRQLIAESGFQKQLRAECDLAFDGSWGCSSIDGLLIHTHDQNSRQERKSSLNSNCHRMRKWSCGQDAGSRKRLRVLTMHSINTRLQGNLPKKCDEHGHQRGRDSLARICIDAKEFVWPGGRFQMKRTNVAGKQVHHLLNKEWVSRIAFFLQ